MTIQDFLTTIGKKVEKAEEVKAEDIVARWRRDDWASFEDVYLYCVRKVQLEPEPKTFIWPAVYLKAPSIGIRVKDGEPFYWHIYSPSPAEKFQHEWYDSQAIANLETDMVNLLDYKPYDLYHITHEDYIALGKLINQVEVPWWSILCQNRHSKANIFNFVADIQEDLRKGKEAYESIQNKVRRWDVAP